MEKKLYHIGLRGSPGAQHARRRQRAARLAHLRRLRAGTHWPRAGNSTPQNPSAWTWIRPPTCSTRRSSICACRSFPWAQFHHGKGAIKLHTQMDLRGNIPCIPVGDARSNRRPGVPRTGSSRAGRDLHPRTAAMWTSAVCRRLVQGSAPLSSSEPRRICDSSGSTTAPSTRARGFAPTRPSGWPTRTPRSAIRNRFGAFILRLRNGQPNRRPDDQFTLPALTVARLYKCRWQVELFFKMDQAASRDHAFLGPRSTRSRHKSGSPSALTCFWPSPRKELRIERSLSEIQQILHVAIFEERAAFTGAFATPSRRFRGRRPKRPVVVRYLPDSSE